MRTTPNRAVVWALAGSLAAGGCGGRQAAPDKTGGTSKAPAAAPAVTLPAPAAEAAVVAQMREDVDRVLGGTRDCATMAEASASLTSALDMAAAKMKQPENKAALEQMKTRVADAAQACR